MFKLFKRATTPAPVARPSGEARPSVDNLTESAALVAADREHVRKLERAAALSGGVR